MLLLPVLEDQLTLNELLDTIAHSDARDWTVVDRPVFLQDMQQVSGGGQPVSWIEVAEHSTLLSYRADLSIAIASGLKHRDSYFEDWARDFPDVNASSHFVDFLYGGVPVLREISVHVDGARAALPAPIVGTTDVPERKYQIWQLLDELMGSGNFDDYFRRAGLVVTKDVWPKFS